MKKYKLLYTIIIGFYLLAVVLWMSTGIVFYLYNFMIIGTAVGLGLGLRPVFPKNKKNKARLISQILVGGYLFFGLGCGLIYLIFGHILPENMQIEGFWFWLLSGVFMAGVIHYAVAKIIGPLLFNRAWCGWACWTAAVLDVLPWKVNTVKRPAKYRRIRYIHFILSASVVFILYFGFNYGLPDTLRKIDLEEGIRLSDILSDYFLRIPELWWFIGGNIFYYAIGVGLAFMLKDNRAFCKYVCPIPVFMKLGSKYSLLKIDKTGDDCINCKRCEKHCPMDIEIMSYINSGRRVNSSECIFCHTCIDTCPKNILGLTFNTSGRTRYHP